MKFYALLFLGALATLPVFAQKAPRTKTVPSLCDSVQFYYTAQTNVVPGFVTTFSWSRAAVTGIANAAATGNSGIINEYLDNTTPDPVLVKYAIAMVENNGCSHEDSLFITIFPTPHLNSAQVFTMCDSTLFTYTATTLTSGTTFTWSRPAVAGIQNSAASGPGTFVSEVLSNTTNNDILVKYLFTMTANGCSNTDTVYVTVHPTPFLVYNYQKKRKIDVTGFSFSTIGEAEKREGFWFLI